MLEPESIFLYIVHSQGFLKQKALPYIQQYNELLTKEDVGLHDEIKKQYEQILKELIINEMSSSLGVSAEEANIGIEGLDIINYIIK